LYTSLLTRIGCKRLGAGGKLDNLGGNLILPQLVFTLRKTDELRLYVGPCRRHDIFGGKSFEQERVPAAAA
jgi:hypothetical protein